MKKHALSIIVHNFAKVRSFFLAIKLFSWDSIFTFPPSTAHKVRIAPMLGCSVVLSSGERLDALSLFSRWPDFPQCDA